MILRAKYTRHPEMRPRPFVTVPKRWNKWQWRPSYWLEDVCCTEAQPRAL